MSSAAFTPAELAWFARTALPKRWLGRSAAELERELGVADPSRSERFAAARARAIEVFLGVANPEGGRPTFVASEVEAITAPAGSGAA